MVGAQLGQTNQDLGQCLLCLRFQRQPKSTTTLYSTSSRGMVDSLVWILLKYCASLRRIFCRRARANCSSLHFSAHDRPDKAQGIEIYSCYDFERMRYVTPEEHEGV